MTTVCSTAACGTGGWNGPLPGDPDNSSVLSAVSDFGGVQLTWTLPSTNAHAVAYTQIYRSIADVFETAIPFTAVSATAYFDRSAVDVIRPYYYWIQHVSVNGTVLDPIGPAMAVAKPQIDQVLADLAGRIESSSLSDTLRQRIDVISDLENGLTQINNKVVSDNEVFAQELMALRDTLTGALAYIDEQQTLSITERQALVTSLNTQLTQFGEGLYAAIQDEATTRASETGELFAQKVLKIDLAGNVSGYGLTASVDPSGQFDSEFQVRADTFSIAAPAVNQETAPENPYNGMVWVDTSVTPGVTRWFNKAAGAWQTTPVKGSEPFVYRSTPMEINGYTLEPGLYVNGAVIDKLTANQLDTTGISINSETFTDSIGWQLNKNGLMSAKSGSNKIIVSPDNALIQFSDANDKVTFAVDSTGTALFGGSLTSATGTFAGVLAAGVLDNSAFDSITQVYSNPGTFEVSIPPLKAGWTSMVMRVTLFGAGGGGGGGHASARPNRNPTSSGGGGGAGQKQIIELTSGFTPGGTATLVVGYGGVGGYPTTGENETSGSGTNGGATQITIGGGTYTAIGGTGGGGGATWRGDQNIGGPGGSIGGITGSGGLAVSVYGGAGGSSEKGAGGAGGPASYRYAGQGGHGGIAAGGGGGGADAAHPDYGYAHYGGNGGNGYALIEFYDPNTVVLNKRYSALIQWLDTVGHGAVPTAAR